MSAKELVYRWEWAFSSPPAALWPFVSDTDRFNRDCEFPAVTVVPLPADDPAPANNRRRIRTQVFGSVIEWDEEPFEWIEPHEFRVQRVYRRGPVAAMTTTCRLAAGSGGGTRLTYEMRIVPAGLVGRLTIPLAIGRFTRRTIERVFRRYDGYARRGARDSTSVRPAQMAEGGEARLAQAQAALATEAGQRPDLAAKLSALIRTGDDPSLARLRCYAVADEWQEDRREMLSLFLHATRAGILDFSWDIVCPHCRGTKQSEGSLLGISRLGRCDSCDIDFTVDFDQSVELTFSPNRAIRPVVRADFCVGGPQVTPHIVAQVSLAPGQERSVDLDLQPGRYRVRALGETRLHPFLVDPEASAQISLRLDEPPGAEAKVAPRGRVVLSGRPGTVVVEHVSWTDQATSAAEVTALQVFRDLFSREVLRPGENISVGSMCVVFTDLKNSTQMYRQIGDAHAFGRVLTHFDILREEITRHGGGIVKTMGDAVMAVFSHPRDALAAVTRAGGRLAGLGGEHAETSPLLLKAGIHFGPCLAINQNDHLDYFGTTVNLAARLCGLCRGAETVISPGVAADPGVILLLHEAGGMAAQPDRALLNGFGSEPIEVFRIRAKP